MTKATVLQVREAFPAVRRLSSIALPAKASWRLSRLLGKLKSVVIDFEEAQRKTFMEHGGEINGNSVEIKNPVRGKETTDEQWAVVTQNHEANIKALNDELTAINEESVEIDYDPIPLSLFGDAKVAANDLADAGPFLSE